MVTVVLISPFLYFFFFGHQYPPGATPFPADLVSFGLPPPLVALTRRQPPFVGANNEAYLGLPLIVLIVAFMWQERRSRTAWLIGVVAAGGRAVLARRPPDASAATRPRSRGPGCCWRSCRCCSYAIPVRLALFATLPAALIVACGSAASRGQRPRRRVALGAGRAGRRVHRPRRRQPGLEHARPRPGVLRQRQLPRAT